VYHLIERLTSTHWFEIPGGIFIIVTTDDVVGVTLVDPASLNAAES
jgi:hypothetical protein